MPARSSKLTVFLLACFFGLFLWAGWQLLKLRIEQGDDFPAYSSLRSDPLGCKGFYESLGVAGLEVRRNLGPLERMDLPRSATLLMAGAGRGWREDVSREEAGILAGHAFRGGRLVIAMINGDILWFNALLDDPGEEVVEEQKGTGEPSLPYPVKDRRSRLEKLLGFRFRVLKEGAQILEKTVSAQRTDVAAGLPDSYAVHTRLYFQPKDPAWQVLYTAHGGKAMLMERSWGKGSVVLMSDSYSLSNEALLTDPQPGLLAWLAGLDSGNRTVIFEETHLGVIDPGREGSVAGKFRLRPLLGGLLLIMLLVLWRMSAQRMPRAAWSVPAAPGPVAGRDAAGGFVSLLKRHIPEPDLLETCLLEWRKTAGRDRRARQHTEERIRAVLDARDRSNLLQTYQTISQILAERK